MRDADTNGLDDATARERLLRDGANAIERRTRRSTLAIARSVLAEPMFLLLIAGGATYALLGDHLEAAILLLFAGASVMLTIVQEVRSERALDALRALAAPRARAIRGGRVVDLPARDIVRGDLLLLDAGDRIAADADLIGAAALEVDEAILTGESMPVAKSATGDAHLLGGTVVARGTARARVVATGAASAIGRIAEALGALDLAAPRLRDETRRIIRIAGVGGGLVTAVVILGYGVLRGDWIAGLLAGIALGMALLPEEFAVVLAVYLAMGVRRIAASGVLVRRAAAIDTLGATTVLCTDKTGTLTENRMQVAAWWTDASAAERSESLAGLQETAAMACPPSSGDGTDTAIAAAFAGRAALAPVTHVYPLRPDLFAVGVARAALPGLALVAIKGAPEAVLALCDADAALQARIQETTAAWTADGRRVLAVARATTDAAHLPETLSGLQCTFVGLVALADPVRTEAPAAVAALRGAGIRVVMITGDHPLTAAAIARESGIDATRVVTGGEIAACTPDTLRTAAVFARVAPDQKLALVQALQRAGEVVAMIGDGVNDAPALRAADIGVAMGQRGTDVAREAGDIVLLDDRFASIVDTVRLGRRIYGNIGKAAEFIVAIHVPIAGLALLPLLLGRPALLGPLHIAMIEIVIDPICALVFEAQPGDDDAMQRPPRRPDARLFDAALLIRAAMLGLLAFAAAAAVALLAPLHVGADETRTLVFLTIVGTLPLMMRATLTGRGTVVRTAASRVTIRVVASIVGLLAILFAVPPLRDAFGFVLPWTR